MRLSCNKVSGQKNKLKMKENSNKHRSSRSHDDNGVGLNDKRVDCHAWVQARNDGMGGSVWMNTDRHAFGRAHDDNGGLRH
jgi:hypothetical protein